MPKSLAVTIAVLACLSGTPARAAGDPQAGKAAASTACAGCHGARGISSNADYPNLAGQAPAYLQKSLREFRSGQRKNPSMNRIANKLSDADIANLSAYYASSLRR